jgi:hypothetical protein
VMTEASLQSKRTPREIILKALPNVLPSATGNQKKALSGTKNDPFAKYRKGGEASSEKSEEDSKEESDSKEEPEKTESL